MQLANIFFLVTETAKVNKKHQNIKTQLRHHQENNALSTMFHPSPSLNANQSSII